jgi:hypothetical protein
MVTYSYTEERDKGTVSAAFAVTNWTSDFSLNCDANDDLATADVLGTLIAELIRQGILKGSVATA